MGDQSDKGDNVPAIRAAEYVRMSTEHQQYSTDNQMKVIRQYAAAHGMAIVRTYGLTGRHGLHGPLPDLWSEWSQCERQVNDPRELGHQIKEFDASGISLEWNRDRSPHGGRTKPIRVQMLTSFSPNPRRQQVRRISAHRERFWPSWRQRQCSAPPA
jgi:hypothetical protein